MSDWSFIKVLNDQNRIESQKAVAYLIGDRNEFDRVNQVANKIIGDLIWFNREVPAHK